MTNWRALSLLWLLALRASARGEVSDRMAAGRRRWRALAGGMLSRPMAWPVAPIGQHVRGAGRGGGATARKCRPGMAARCGGAIAEGNHAGGQRLYQCGGRNPYNGPKC